MEAEVRRRVLSQEAEMTASAGARVSSRVKGGREQGRTEVGGELYAFDGSVVSDYERGFARVEVCSVCRARALAGAEGEREEGGRTA